MARGFKLNLALAFPNFYETAGVVCLTSLLKTRPTQGMMMMKFSMRTIPAAAAMTAALIFGIQAQAQTTAQPSTAAGDKAAMPAGPNTSPTTPAQRDMAKPMAKQGATAGSMGAGDSANRSAGSADQPVRQAGKIAKNKEERMAKGNKPKASMNKSNEPVRESDIKDMPAK